MSKRTWAGTAQSVQQVSTITMNADTNGNTYQLTLTDELGTTATASFTSTGGGTTANATGLAAAINASSSSIFRNKVTATSLTNVVTVTSVSAGVPFNPSLGGTGVAQMTLATPTANSGPNDWNVAANWAENTVPVGGDDVTITGSSAILYGVTTGLTFGNVLLAPGSSNAIGRPGIPLSFISTSFISYNQGVCWIDLKTSAIAPLIWKTGSASDPAMGLNLYGSALTTVTQYSGSIGYAMTAGSTATVTTHQIVGSSASQASVRFRTGTTVTTITADNGTVNLDVAATTVSMSGGTLNTNGTGAIGTITNNGATMVLNSTGTVTALNQNSGSSDTTQSLAARTITTVTIIGGSFSYDRAVVTLTNPIATTMTGPQTVTVT